MLGSDSWFRFFLNHQRESFSNLDSGPFLQKLVTYILIFETSKELLMFELSPAKTINKLFLKVVVSRNIKQCLGSYSGI